jgi:hypothetical protein
MQIPDMQREINDTIDEFGLALPKESFKTLYNEYDRSNAKINIKIIRQIVKGRDFEVCIDIGLSI